MAVADSLEGIPEDNLAAGKEACFAVDFVGFVRLAALPEADSSYSGHRPAMGQLAEMGQGLDSPVRFFYGALPL